MTRSRVAFDTPGLPRRASEIAAGDRPTAAATSARVATLCPAPLGTSRSICYLNLMHLISPGSAGSTDLKRAEDPIVARTSHLAGHGPPETCSGTQKGSQIFRLTGY